MEVRHQYFDVPDLKTLFMDVDPSQIFAFLKAIGFFKNMNMNASAEDCTIYFCFLGFSSPKQYNIITLGI